MDVIGKKEKLLQKKEKIKQEEKKLIQELQLLNKKERNLEAQAMIIFFKYLLKHNRKAIDEIITSENEDVKNYFVKKTKKETIDYRVYLQNIITKEQAKQNKSE